MLWFEFQGQHLPNSSFWESELNGALSSGDHVKFRSLYELMLQETVSIHIITADDATTYAEIYSLTPPTYVPSYDEKTEELAIVLAEQCSSLPALRHALTSDDVRDLTDKQQLERHSWFDTPFRRLLQFAGGEWIEDRFITQTGVRVVRVSQNTDDFRDLLFEFGCLPSNTKRNEADEITASAAFEAQLTYMFFRGQEPTEYVQRVVKGHRSIFNDTHVSVLIVGMATETMIELTSHKELSVARLTTSKTAAMRKPMYRIFGGKRQQKQQIQLIKQRDMVSDGNFVDANALTLEQHNMQNPASKALCAVISGSIKDWAKICTSRTVAGDNEMEVRHIFSRVYLQLRKFSPALFPPKNLVHLQQYFTPANLAFQLVSQTTDLVHREFPESRFAWIDPSAGTGAFYDQFTSNCAWENTAFEIDIDLRRPTQMCTGTRALSSLILPAV